MENRLFRALLRLLPEEFRAGYARDMEATFRAERRDASRRGGATALWLATAGDVLRRAPAEHVDILRRDARFALRVMAARPLHTVTAIVTLALGIGANVAMFAVVDAVLFTPLPYPEASALVTVAETEDGADPSNMGYLTFVDLAKRAQSFERLAAVGASSATLTGDGLEAERVNAMRASRTYFDILGVRPALGRAFTDVEDKPGAARRVVILSDQLWRRRYGADPGVIDRTITISDTAYRVVGVLPAGFDDLVAARLYDGAELWTPLGYDPAASFACRTCRHLRVFGRLANGVELDTAERELNQIFAALENEHPTEYHQAGAELTRFADVFLGPVRPALLVLWAGVGVTRGRLTRQLLTESALLGGLAGAVGFLPTWGAVRALSASGPVEIPRLAEAAVDGRVALAAIGLTVAAVILFGLVPLRFLLGRDPGASLHGAGRRTESVATWRARSALVATNVALAALLLVGSGLLVKSVSGLLAVSPGFDAAGVLTMRLWATGARFREGDNAAQVATAVRFYDEILTQARALPGVTAAAAVTTLPLGGGVDGYGFHVEGRPSANPEAAPSADRFVVTPGFFDVLRVSLVRGRLLDADDRQDGAPVAVVNRTAARELFGGADAIGQRVSLGSPGAVARTIVGVVEDIRHHGLDVPVGYQVYVPQAQWAWAETYLTLVVRSDADPTALAGPIRKIVRATDPAQPITDVRPYEEIVGTATGTRRLAASLLSVFAGAALVLAVVGLYGALAVLVGQRRQEIGLRMALGARADHIRRLVLGRGLRPVAVGLVVGLGMATLAVRALRSMLFDVDALDPASFGGAALLLAACAVAASLLPAWRASRIDPARTLRAD